jgi:hypothetical protein
MRMLQDFIQKGCIRKKNIRQLAVFYFKNLKLIVERPKNFVTKRKKY